MMMMTMMYVLCFLGLFLLFCCLLYITFVIFSGWPARTRLVTQLPVDRPGRGTATVAGFNYRT